MTASCSLWITLTLTRQAASVGRSSDRAGAAAVVAFGEGPDCRREARGEWFGQYREMADAPAPTSEAQQAVPETERSGKSAAALSIEIKLAGAVIRVTSGTDTALLAEVLRAIRASAA